MTSKQKNEPNIIQLYERQDKYTHQGYIELELWLRFRNSLRSSNRSIDRLNKNQVQRIIRAKNNVQYAAVIAVIRRFDIVCALISILKNLRSKFTDNNN